MTNRFTNQLQIGNTYHVITKTGTIEGRYLGTDYADRYLFDLRPDSGTTTVAPGDVVHIRETLPPQGSGLLPVDTDADGAPRDAV